MRKEKKKMFMCISCSICCSYTQSCPILCDPMDCSKPGLPVHQQLQEFTQIHVHWVSDAIQPSHPLSSPSPPAFSLSQHQGLFQWVNSLHHVTKVLAFQLQYQSFQWIFGLISFRTDRFELLAVQGTLNILFQHHNSKASILLYLAFYMVQPSYPYMTTGKTIVLTMKFTKLLHLRNMINSRKNTHIYEVLFIISYNCIQD